MENEAFTFWALFGRATITVKIVMIMLIGLLKEVVQQQKIVRMMQLHQNYFIVHKVIHLKKI